MTHRLTTKAQFPLHELVADLVANLGSRPADSSRCATCRAPVADLARDLFIMSNYEYDHTHSCYCQHRGIEYYCYIVISMLLSKDKILN